MKPVHAATLVTTLVTLLCIALATGAVSEAADPEPADAGAKLVAALLGETPILEDLRVLTDEIGGRPTGSEANDRAVDWALERFRKAGVWVESEPFEMPVRWLERSASARIVSSDGAISFAPRVAAMPYSPGTMASETENDGLSARAKRKKKAREEREAEKDIDAEEDDLSDSEDAEDAEDAEETEAETLEPQGLTARLVDAGHGTEQDFARLGAAAEGAWALIETDELHDLAGLFAEYATNAALEPRAFAAGVAGLAYVGSRGSDLLYRHNSSRGPETDRPMIVVERDAGLRALRLLRAGKELELTAVLDIDAGPAYRSYNVIAEIKGSAEPEEFVVIGAHLDSWGLGTGALDNGCNVALVIDIARQMRRLHIVPQRTIRFALFNGEEQGLTGSFGYTKMHRNELDAHVMASSYDIGSGRIEGFFTNGRPQLAAAVDRALEAVAELGPFAQIDVPVVGTDNYDFMMQGVGNLIASQASANYGPHYHARSDTFDKVDQAQLKKNAAIAAAVTWSFANMEVDWHRQSRAEIEALIAGSDLQQQMKSFGLWRSWLDGSRGRAIEP